MWKILKTHVPGSNPAVHSTAQQQPAASERAVLQHTSDNADVPGAAAARPRNNILRQALASATRASELNTVRVPGLHDRDVQQMRMREEATIGLHAIQKIE
eukprot:71835-Pleurochrysis_carterae.AAC.1